MIPHYPRALLLAAVVWHAAHAAPIYKWVDSTGHVTYSSVPPPAGARALKVDVPPQPSAEEARQAGERAKRAQEQAGDLEARRRKQEEKEAEEARLRAMQSPPPPVVIETPVYVPQPIYYPPVIRPPRKPHPDQRPHDPLPHDRPRPAPR